MKRLPLQGAATPRASPAAASAALSSYRSRLRSGLPLAARFLLPPWRLSDDRGTDSRGVSGGRACRRGGVGRRAHHGDVQGLGRYARHGSGQRAAHPRARSGARAGAPRGRGRLSGPRVHELVLLQGVRDLDRARSGARRGRAVQDPIPVRSRQALAATKPRRADLLRRRPRRGRRVSVDQSPPQTVPDLPPQVMARFRLVSLERLERIDAAWQALIAGSGSEADGETLTRELHTLKGDARVLGLGDVGMLSQRVEDLVFAALRRRFQVHEDVDIVMTMAIQFLGMLIRRKAGMVSGGIDLEGFLKQVDAVTLEWLQQPSSIPAPNTGGSARRVRTVEPVSATPDTRDRLASLTTDVYLEHLRATGATRDRLHATFAGLARAVEELGEVALGPVVEQHLAAAKALARELGKE